MLLDTNILLRTIQPAHPHHVLATDAAAKLRWLGIVAQVRPQNIVELWAVATRPAAQNGLGLSPERAATEVGKLLYFCKLLPDNPRIHPIWESLVVEHRVSGKPTHDARIVAAMKSHGLTNILTFNGADFTRFPGITVVHPSDLVRKSLGYDILGK